MTRPLLKSWSIVKGKKSEQIKNHLFLEKLKFQKN